MAMEGMRSYFVALSTQVNGRQRDEEGRRPAAGWLGVPGIGCCAVCFTVTDDLRLKKVPDHTVKVCKDCE